MWINIPWLKLRAGTLRYSQRKKIWVRCLYFHLCGLLFSLFVLLSYPFLRRLMSLYLVCSMVNLAFLFCLNLELGFHCCTTFTRDILWLTRTTFLVGVTLKNDHLNSGKNYLIILNLAARWNVIATIWEEKMNELGALVVWIKLDCSSAWKQWLVINCRFGLTRGQSYKHPAAGLKA
jgi:hypothetical protein